MCRMWWCNRTGDLITDYAEQSPSVEANSRSAGQEVSSFIELESSLPCQHDVATSASSELDESNAGSYILLILHVSSLFPLKEESEGYEVTIMFSPVSLLSPS
jgi:hypothetical protein